jgi:hypothetical protein
MLTTERITRCSVCGKVLKSAADWSACRAEHSLDAYRRSVGEQKYAEYVDWFNSAARADRQRVAEASTPVL